MKCYRTPRIIVESLIVSVIIIIKIIIIIMDLHSAFRSEDTVCMNGQSKKYKKQVVNVILVVLYFCNLTELL